jgi:hypothetical protein
MSAPLSPISLAVTPPIRGDDFPQTDASLKRTPEASQNAQSSSKVSLDLLRHAAQQQPKSPKMPTPVNLKVKGFPAVGQNFSKLPPKMLWVTGQTSRGNA